MLEFTNEIKPKFPPKVQAIWEDCGTYVASMEVNILCQGVSMILQVVHD